MSNWRDYLDSTLAILAAFVAVYFHKSLSEKRIAFEKANPRIASAIGIIAGIVPFIPMIASGFKGVITGQHPSAAGNHPAMPEVPVAPWSESPSDVPSTDTGASNGEESQR